MTERLHFHFSLSCIEEGNGNPLQCSCLENPREEGAWWGAVFGSHRVGHDWSDLAAAAAYYILGFLGDSVVKNLPAVQKTQYMKVQSLGQEDLPEKEMATHSSIFAWEISWTEEPGRLQSIPVAQSRTWLSTYTHTYYILYIVCLSIIIHIYTKVNKLQFQLNFEAQDV